MASAAKLQLKKALLAKYPWAKSPLIVGAPMRVMAGPAMAVQVSHAGGIGFLGPQIKRDSIYTDFDEVAKLVQANPVLSPHSSTTLPVGVGFQTWNDDLEHSIPAIAKYKPCAVWLFAPRDGQAEFDTWSSRIRAASPATQIWAQVGTLGEAVAAANAASGSRADVLVIQGSEAGGHGRAKDGMGTMVLFPEVADALKDAGIPLVAAGGIIDARGVAAALSLGAAGAAMGTRFLAASEARIAKGYQDEVVRGSDGASSTVRTHLYNHLRGTFGWPEQWAPRTMINRSWEEHVAGESFETLQTRHDEAAKKGDAGWGPDGRLATYVGAGVGLVRDVKGAGEIVSEVRQGAVEILKGLVDEA